MIRKNKELLFLLFILAIAAFFRLWQLDSIPPGFYPDVAMNGNNAIDTLRTGNFKVFYPDNNGREGLFIWLIALSFSLFGISIWSIKIVAATVGIFTILGLYLLTKELFVQCNEVRPRYIALLSSFFLAVSFWHTNFSRIGFRAILLPFILVFAFYFLFRGFRIQKVWNFIAAGVFFGLGFYTYTSYRFIVLLLPLALIPWFLIYKKRGETKKFILFIVYCLLFTVVIALPLAIYYLKNPQDFIGRATQVSIFAQKNPISAFGQSLISHLSMFNFYGDYNWRHNFSGYPMLFLFVGALFLIGFILSLKNLISPIKNKECLQPAPPDPGGIRAGFPVFCFLLSWFFIMLLPGILSYEGIPHGLRTIGTIPVVHIFAGLGGWKTYEFVRRNTERKKLLCTAVSLSILAVGISEFTKYFSSWGWAKFPKVEDAFTKRYADIGYYLNSLPEETQKYVIVNEFGVPLYGISIPGQTPMFIESTKFGYPHSIYLRVEDLDKIKIGRQKTVIVPLYDGKIFEELQKRFLQGKVNEKEGFSVYEIK